MYRPFEQGKIEFEENNFNSEIPQSEMGDSFIDLKENKNENSSAWQSLIDDAEIEMEKIREKIKMLQGSSRVYEGQEITEERRVGLLKTLDGDLRLQESIIQMAKNNME